MNETLNQQEEGENLFRILTLQLSVNSQPRRLWEITLGHESKNLGFESKWKDEAIDQTRQRKVVVPSAL